MTFHKVIAQKCHFINCEKKGGGYLGLLAYLIVQIVSCFKRKYALILIPPLSHAYTLLLTYFYDYCHLFFIPLSFQLSQLLI